MQVGEAGVVLQAAAGCAIHRLSARMRYRFDLAGLLSAGARACCLISREGKQYRGAAEAAACRSLSGAGWITRASGSVRHERKGGMHLFRVALPPARTRHGAHFSSLLGRALSWARSSHRLMRCMCV